MTTQPKEDGDDAIQIMADLKLANSLVIFGHRKAHPEAIKLGEQLQQTLMVKLAKAPPPEQDLDAADAGEITSRTALPQATASTTREQLGRIDDDHWRYRIDKKDPQILDPGDLDFLDKVEVTMTAIAEDSDAKLFIYWRRVGQPQNEDDFGAGTGKAIGRWKPKGRDFEVTIENRNGPDNMLVEIERTYSR
ncbi:MAG: hypothetical protein ACKVP0_20945 [Pirellulaceae bacterium]